MSCGLLLFLFRSPFAILSFVGDCFFSSSKSTITPSVYFLSLYCGSVWKNWTAARELAVLAVHRNACPLLVAEPGEGCGAPAVPIFNQHVLFFDLHVWCIGEYQSAPSAGCFDSVSPPPLLDAPPLFLHLYFVEDRLLTPQLARLWSPSASSSRDAAASDDPPVWLVGAVVAGRHQEAFTLGSRILRALRQGVQISLSHMPKLADPQYDWTPHLPPPAPSRPRPPRGNRAQTPATTAQ